MSENTAKVTDPIWDSRNSDEPPAPDTNAAQKLEEEWIAREIMIRDEIKRYVARELPCQYISGAANELAKCRSELQKAFGLTSPT